MVRILAVVAIAGLTALAQDPVAPPPPPPPPHDVMFGAVGGGIGEGMAGPIAMKMISGEMAFDVKPISGAPYTAQATTETVQTLADGNRIRHTTTAMVARDSQGRTRREQSFDFVPLAGQAQPQKVVFIHDPVAQTSYVLNPDHTAQKMPFLTQQKMPFVTQMSQSVSGGASTRVMIATSVAPDRSQFSDKTGESSTEQLGQQMMEGVQAQGKRITTVIPAGAIGNEQPLTEVTETWYSPELQTLVSSTRTDPRTGTTTYKLTNIQRSEPPADLFQVPSDYTVNEMPKEGQQFIYRQVQTSK